MNFLTVLIIAIIIISFFYGFSRGIVKEVSSLCAVVIAIIACRLFGSVAVSVVAHFMGSGAEESATSAYTASIIGNALLFLAVWLGVFAFARMLRGAIHAIHLGFIDGLAGAAFCVLKWMIVLSLVLNLLHLISPDAGMWGSNPPEGLINAALGVAPWLFGLITAT